MEIIQQPDILSFAGNVNDFVIEDVTKSLVFKLSVDDVVVVNEVYVADGGMVRVPMKDIVGCFLSISVPRSDLDYMIQSLAVKKFKAEIEDTVVEFTAVKGGISNVSESSTVFLKTQWLTLQPQEKRIVTHQPEYLSYYAAETCFVKMTVYFSDGLENETLLALEAGNLYTVDVSYLKISGKFERVVGCYDVWVENEAGQRLTYVQRYILSQSNTETNVYLFENTLGGIDSVVFTGKFMEKIQTEGIVTTVLDESTDSDIDLNFSCEQNTGFIPSIDYARWLRGFFVSKQRYHVSGALRRIYLRESENGFTKNSLNDFTFEFFYSKQTKYDVVTRNRDELPCLLEFPEVNSFPFLAPRLAEFPIAVVADDLMLPVQYAFENAWRRISVAAIAQAVSRETIDNINLSSYWKKTELVREGLYLKFLDKYIRVKFADRAGNAERWAGHLFRDKMDQAVREFDDVRFNSIQSTKFASGFDGFGYMIDEKGFGELLGLRLREFLEVPELRFNRIDVVSGELWNAVAFGLIESVDTEKQVVSLKLEDGEMSGIRVNDICRGLFHNLTGNADGSVIDACGFSTLPGFSTSYFTPVEILDNGKRFRYELKEGTTVHPCSSMKYVTYGNFTDKDRRASAYLTKTYKRYLKGVRTWEVGAGNIAMQFGNLSGLNVGGVDMSGYSAYLNNVYFTGTLQWTPEQLEEIKGQDGYSVTLTTYDMSIGVDAEGNINQALYDVENVSTGEKLVSSANKQVVNTRYKIQTIIQAYKGGKRLIFSETPGAGVYSVAFASRGCNFIFNNDIITVTGITADTAFVEMEVNCEGNVVFEKRFSLVKVYDGASGDWISHVFKKSNSRPVTPVSTSSIPEGWEDAPGGDGRWWMSKATVNGLTGKAGEWSGAVQVTAEDGVDGAYTDFKFRKSASMMEVPVIDRNARVPAGWSDEPPVLSPGEFLWMSKAEVDAYDKLKGTWSVPVRISGERGERGQQGLQGLQGERGERGIQGPTGQNGKTSYFHIKYSSKENGDPMTEIPSAYIGTYVDYDPLDSTLYTRYTWHRFEGLQGAKGDQGIPGVGVDGKTSYLHIKYSNDGGKTFTGNNGETAGDWIGVCTDFNLDDPATVGAYAWSKVKGDKGEKGDQGLQGLRGLQGERGLQGVAGPRGLDGQTSYFHIKYSAVVAPTTASQMTETPSEYIGTYVDYTQADSSDPLKYTWARFKGLQGNNGERGIPGVNGVDGKTSYLHIKYSNDGGVRFTDNNGETPGDWIGVCTDFNLNDPSTVSSYTWSKVKGADGDILSVPWLSDWDSNKIEIGGEYVVSPKMFSGTRGSDGKLTGVVFGRGVIEIDGVKKTGVFGLKDGNITFSIDENGDAFYGGSINVNNKFIVNDQGNLECKEAKISGEVNATSGVFGGSIQTTLKKIKESDATHNGSVSFWLMNDLQVDASGDCDVYLPNELSYVGKRCMIVNTAQGLSRVPITTYIKVQGASRILGVSLSQTQIDNGEYCNKIGFFGGYVELLGVVISVGTSTEITKVCHWMVIGMSGTYLDTYLTT